MKKPMKPTKKQIQNQSVKPESSPIHTWGEVLMKKMKKPTKKQTKNRPVKVGPSSVQDWILSSRAPYENGEIVEENGKKYKVRLVRIKGPEEIPPGIEGFRAVGFWWKVVKSELTKRMKVPGSVPMPTGPQASAISTWKALEGIDRHEFPLVVSELLSHLTSK